MAVSVQCLRGALEENPCRRCIPDSERRGIELLIAVLEVMSEYSDDPVAARAYEEFIRDVILPPGPLDRCHTSPDWHWLERFAEVILPASLDQTSHATTQLTCLILCQDYLTR